MKTLEYQYFQYLDELRNWVNARHIEIVSICSNDNGREGFILFYR